MEILEAILEFFWEVFIKVSIFLIRILTLAFHFILEIGLDIFDLITNGKKKKRATGSARDNTGSQLEPTESLQDSEQ